MTGWLRGWVVPLRMARRDALRWRARSALVLVMIALPVLAVTAADVVLSTVNVQGAESLDRRLGAATASVTVQPSVDVVYQGPDPEDSAATSGSGSTPPLSADEVSALLGGAPLVERRDGEIGVTTDQGVAVAQTMEVDLRAPETRGLVELTSGRLPETGGEVVINQALADKGYAVGDTLDIDTGDASSGSVTGVTGVTGATPTIVGIAESTTVRSLPYAVGPIGAFGSDATADPDAATTWLVGGGPVDWATVRTLNEQGASVLSRAVVLDPPPASELPEEIGYSSGGSDSGVVTVAVPVVVMALIEVVLLAGPAFAVGARRMSRSLALMAAAGGTPIQARRVVLAGGIVLGGAGAVLGVVLGIGLAAAVLPVVQTTSTTWFGPFQVPWLQLLGIGAFGLLSALLAALVPAAIASRQDVVAVLAGRRGDRAASLRSPVVGLVLLGLGVAGAVFGSQQNGGETLIAGSAIFSVLGMILLVPLVLAGLGRVSGRLPLVLRYAVRDAARHRSRTVPAVAAVAATVAGVVALGIGSSSDAAEAQATYQASLPAGAGALIVSGFGTNVAAGVDWQPYRRLLERGVPGADVVDVRGISEYAEADDTSVYLHYEVSGLPYLLSSSGSVLGSGTLVSDDGLPPGLLDVSSSDAERAAEELRGGGAVVFTDQDVPAGTEQVDAVVERYGSGIGDTDPPVTVRTELPATLIEVAPGQIQPQAVLSSAAAEEIGLPVTTTGLYVAGAPISEAAEEAVSEGAAALSSNAFFTVERGYEAEDATVIIQLVLAALGGILMLGGTLTATFLALSDARPDLATLAAVGASPRTRRGVAGAYAVVVGLVGAVLGAVVGFIPGLAVTVPLTSADYGARPTGPYLDVPWLLIIGLVVALPLVTALVVALATRSRLPLVARLD